MQINKLQFSGNLGADAKDHPYADGNETRHRVTFSVAQTRISTGRDGEKVENTTWLDCKAFLTQRNFDTVFPRLVKGASVFLEGHIEIEKKQHNGVTQAYVSLVCKEFHFLPKPARAVDTSGRTSGDDRQERSTAPATSTSASRAEDQHPDSFNPANFGR